VPIVAVTAPWPQMRIPDAITLIPQLVPFATFGSLTNCIEVVIIAEGVDVAAVGDALGDGVTVGEVVAAVVVAAVVVADIVVEAFVLGIALGVWLVLLVVLVVQPANDKEATTSNRTAITVIGFNCILNHVRKR
jgi:hypothetical protein